MVVVRHMLSLALGSILSACTTLGPPPTHMTFASGDVQMAAPDGYCIDRRATREQAAGAFVLLGDCARLQHGQPEAPVPVVLTALVSDPLLVEATPSPSVLSRYFRSDSGRASMARDGQAGSVAILQSETRGDIFYLKFRDSSEGADPQLAQETWRAFVPVRDRLTVLSVMTLAEQPVSSDAALGVLRSFVSRVQTVNAPTQAATQ